MLSMKVGPEHSTFSLHAPHTMEIFLSGGDLNKVTHQRVRTMLSLVAIGDEMLDSIYRLSDNRKYFVTFVENGGAALVQKLHGLSRPHPSMNVAFTFRDVNRAVVAGALRWVPPGMSDLLLRESLSRVAKDDTLVIGKSRRGESDARAFRLELREGMTLPHYLSFEIGSSRLKIMVNLPGRMPACMSCYQEGHPHWRCPLRRPDHTLSAVVAPPAASAPAQTTSTSGEGVWAVVDRRNKGLKDITFVGSKTSNPLSSSSSAPASHSSSPGPSPNSTPDSSPRKSNPHSPMTPPEPLSNLSKKQIRKLKKKSSAEPDHTTVTGFTGYPPATTTGTPAESQDTPADTPEPLLHDPETSPPPLIESYKDRLLSSSPGRRPALHSTGSLQLIPLSPLESSPEGQGPLVVDLKRSAPHSSPDWQTPKTAYPRLDEC